MRGGGTSGALLPLPPSMGGLLRPEEDGDRATVGQMSPARPELNAGP
jgi:hypothetical protein